MSMMETIKLKKNPIDNKEIAPQQMLDLSDSFSFVSRLRKIKNVVPSINDPSYIIILTLSIILA